jgi:hypothetical protein
MEISKQESSGLLTNTFERLEAAEQAMKEIKHRIDGLNPYRSQVIEEVAQHIEKMKGFGSDTISSFAIYIRSLK